MRDDLWYKDNPNFNEVLDIANKIEHFIACVKEIKKDNGQTEKVPVSSRRSKGVFKESTTVVGQKRNKVNVKKVNIDTNCWGGELDCREIVLQANSVSKN